MVQQIGRTLSFDLVRHVLLHFPELLSLACRAPLDLRQRIRAERIKVPAVIPKPRHNHGEEHAAERRHVVLHPLGELRDERIEGPQELLGPHLSDGTPNISTCRCSHSGCALRNRRESAGRLA